jgi:hypothetical protein
MKKIRLSSIIFTLIASLLVVSLVLFFFNPGFVVQLIGIYSLYYVIPISLLLLLIDFMFNHQLEKKKLFYALIFIAILLILSLGLRYWVSNSFSIFP